MLPESQEARMKIAGMKASMKPRAGRWENWAPLK